MEEKKDIIKKSLGCRLFQGIVTGLAYITFRPKVFWQDDSLKHPNKNSKYVFVCNHTHHFDAIFAASVLKKYKPYMLVMTKWYNKKRIGTLIQWTRSIPIDLNSMDSSWYTNCETALKNGSSVLIFPEGAVARDGKMLEFKPGAGMLSAKDGVDVVPVAIYGKYDMLFGKRQKIMIGKPIKSNCPEDMRHSKYAKQLMKTAESDVKCMYNSMVEKYGDIGTYY
ncbi:MAG: lysophospholipid acyltransferase family protein [Ruminococcus bromii]|nr:lysophospholipid acyltransferase family protein [Ruminococcus bromii]